MATAHRKNRKNAKRQPRNLLIEGLERRELMSAGCYLASGQKMVVDGTGSSDHAEVWQKGSRVYAQLYGTTTVFRASAVKKISFWGEGGNDYFRNSTNIRAKAYGDGGNDTLIGGPAGDVLDGGAGDDRLYGNGGNDRIYGRSGSDYIDGGKGADRIEGGSRSDIIYGGKDNDTIYGERGLDKIYDYLVGNAGHDKMFGDAGNDTLYGGQGNDTLHGGPGNDGLFGGVHGDTDTLIGGRDADRLLVQSRDIRNDVESNDAEIIFVNGDVPWSDREVQIVDRAFAVLHEATGNARLLQDPLFDGPLTFVKQSKIVGDNGKTYLGMNSEYTYQQAEDNRSWWEKLFSTNENKRTVTSFRRIDIADWNENSSRGNRILLRTIFHEIGHNWDSRQELEDAGIDPAHNDTFRQIAGWTQDGPVNRSQYYSSRDKEWYYLASDDPNFVRDYGKTNPLEDWATSWEEYFTRLRKGGRSRRNSRTDWMSSMP